MTPRKAASGAGGPALAATSFPHLESFFSGYLHEDFVIEYGSAEGALRAWRMDASAKESQGLDLEAERLLEAAATVPFRTIAAFIRRDLGSAWRPADVTRLQRLFAPATRRSHR